MLLDKLLDYVTVHSEPFATCLLSLGWRLSLPGPTGVMFHFVMQGNVVLRAPAGQQYPLQRFPLAVVPSGISHTMECGLDVQSERVIEAPPTGEGIVRLVAGSQGSAELRVASGAVNGTYGDSLGLFRRLR